MNRKLPKFLSQTAKERLYSAASNCPRDRALVSLGLNAGLRVSEMINLRLQDLDWENAQLRFTAKGNKERRVPINLRLKLDLQAALADRPADTAHDFVLRNKRFRDRGLSRFGAYRLLVRYGARIGFNGNLHPHLLRHTAATDFYRECGDIRRCQVLLGHSRVDTTTIYAAVHDSDVAATLERVNRPNLFVRLLARLRSIPPEWLRVRGPSRPSHYAGGTVGRTRELATLKANAQAGISTVIIAERGQGKSHLLRLLRQELET
ncbi:MAG: tyrosine-type recombinase/integrase [Candidatus Pacearchaeota archaeon]|nr:tyrosine-type recombinase/integrase [Candidatus Pacearchaeota archaeon]